MHNEENTEYVPGMGTMLVTMSQIDENGAILRVESGASETSTKETFIAELEDLKIDHPRIELNNHYRLDGSIDINFTIPYCGYKIQTVGTFIPHE